MCGTFVVSGLCTHVLSYLLGDQSNVSQYCNWKHNVILSIFLSLTLKYMYTFVEHVFLHFMDM